MRILIPVFAFATAAPEAVAQSIVTGAVSGTVLDESGSPMPSAHVILTEVITGLQREQETGAGGRYDFFFLPPGEYEVFAEQLGYRPSRVRGVPVERGGATTVPIRLAPAPPPVLSVDVVEYAGGTLGLQGPSSSRGFSSLELERLPERNREFAELGRFSSVSLETLSVEGLPARLTGMVIDGIPYVGVAHPGLADSTFGSAAFPFSQFAGAELLTNGVDVEYAGLAGASLSGRTVRGTRDLQVRGFADWSGEALRSSDHFDPESVANTTLRGGVLITGPVIRDTAHFVLGAEVRRLETPLPKAWTSTGLDSALLAVAGDSFAVDLAGYLRPRLVTADLVSAFYRFDRQIGEGNALTVRTNFAGLSVKNPHVGDSPFIGLGAKLEGVDANGVAQFTSSLSPTIGMELRVALEYSKRDYRSLDLPATVLAEGPIAFGDDPAFPGRFERLAFRASEAFHLRLGTHQLKVGGSALVASFDHAYAFGRGGQFVFGGINDFAGLGGAFVQSVGPPPSARFITSEFGGFLQDTWRATPGFEMTLGFRVDAEVLPGDEVPLNDAWLERTGLINNAFDQTITKFSPRFGLRWDVGNWHRWLVHVEAGIHHGTVDPGMFAEVVTQNGAPLVRRGIGSLGRWMETPDSAAAPVAGPSLTLPGQGFEAPRTFRTSLGVTVALDPATELDLSGAYRHTELLPRRHDLNLPLASGRDQFGRPVYGRLDQQGSVVGPEPGSNRRFTEFDLVSSLDADGVSDYWGFTATLERRVDGFLNLVASYTYSRTEDNLLTGGGPGGGLSPFPSGLNGREWSDGLSDFDVPHRVTVGAELDVSIFRLAGFFRHQTGFPFTPGFRNGVDANGDGSFSNDPAFIDDGIPGVADLLSQWECLRTQLGRFAKKNSCRADPINTLDVRLAFRVLEMAGYGVQIVADGLNLLDSKSAALDRALYLVDASGTLVTDAATGDVTVPLIVNPSFGRPAHFLSSGRFIRVGVKIGS